MKKKISRSFILIAFFSILVTTLAMTLVFYTQFKKQVFSDLKDVATILIVEGAYAEKTDDLRITVIDADGRVSFDSVVDEQTLENHLDRPEVEEALEGGVGLGERRSTTLSMKVFYYAKLMDNGQILRVGKEAHSVLSVFISTLPIIVLVALVLGGISYALSHYLTLSIVRPIDEMAGDMDSIRDDGIYPELIPFTRKIRTQHEEILAAANIRQEFTANVSHELKTPLAAISGYAELMEAGMAGEKEVRHFSGEICKSAARLLALINDIIRLSQLDAGSALEVLEEVNLAMIAKESVEMLSLGAQKKQITLVYEGDEQALLKIGRELAQELLFNLIENSVRYNRPGGRVWVKVRQNGKITKLIVADTGIGIPKEHQERVFERFYRVDKSRSKALGGTGLGLAIVKHICTVTGGEIRLNSEPGKGTEITVSWTDKKQD